MLRVAANCTSVQSLLTAAVQPSSFTGRYGVSDEVNFYTGSPADLGVVTAVCEPPEALGPVDRTLRCVFDFTDDTYKLLGDSLECAGQCSLQQNCLLQDSGMCMFISMTAT